MAKATTIEIKEYKQKQKEKKRSKWVAKTLIVVDMQLKGPLKSEQGQCSCKLGRAIAIKDARDKFHNNFVT
jgi:hypothetical protein